MGHIVKLIFISVLSIALLSGVAQAAAWNKNVAVSGPENYNPVISGDGKKIVYVHDFDPQVNDGSGCEIMLYDVETGTTKRLTNNAYYDDDPAISDDGSRIVYKRQAQDHTYVKVINSEGTELASKELSYYSSPSLSISGNGAYVAFSDEKTGNHTLWAMKWDGTGLIQLAHDTGWYYPSVLNYDGSRLAYTHGDEVAIVNRADGQQIGHNSDTNNYLTYSVDISDDGSRVVYQSDAVRVMNSVGTGNKVLADNNMSPRISGDGLKVAFVGMAGDSSYAIYTIAWDGTGLEQVKTIESNSASMDKSGSTFAYAYNGNIYTVTKSGTAVGGQYNPVTPGGNSQYVNVGTGSYTLSAVRFSSAEAESGTVSIPVKGINLKKVGSMDLGLKYDPALLRFKGASAGSLTGNSMLASNDAGNGLINVGIVDASGISGNGSIAVLTFEVVDNAPVQSCDLLVQSLKASNTTGKAIYLSSINGTFTATSVKGDANGDGKITSVDALIALQMSVGKQAADLAADANGDGQVTAADALEILQQATSTATKIQQVQASRPVTGLATAGGKP